jgi:hypothetical protein
MYIPTFESILTAGLALSGALTKRTFLCPPTSTPLCRPLSTYSTTMTAYCLDYIAEVHLADLSCSLQGRLRLHPRL